MDFDERMAAVPVGLMARIDLVDVEEIRSADGRFQCGEIDRFRSEKRTRIELLPERMPGAGKFSEALEIEVNERMVLRGEHAETDLDFRVFGKDAEIELIRHGTGLDGREPRPKQQADEDKRDHREEPKETARFAGSWHFSAVD